MWHCIYGLVDPDDNLVHYVGKTSCPDSRWKQHLSTSTGPVACVVNAAKSRWIRNLLARGKRPLVRILYQSWVPIPDDVLRRVERECMRELATDGHPITNVQGMTLPNGKRQVGFQIDPTQYARFVAVVRRQKTTVSAVLRQLIARFLENNGG